MNILLQLRKLAFAINNSTTILYRWNEIIEEYAAVSTLTKKLMVRNMPQDISTRQNSTYKMLKFACTYSEPINRITTDHSMKIHQYGLNDYEWTIIKQLQDSLELPDAKNNELWCDDEE